MSRLRLRECNAVGSVAAREASDLVSLRFSLREAWLRARSAAKRAARSLGGGGAAAVSDACAACVVAVEGSVGGVASDALGAVVVAEVGGATSSSANRRLEGSPPSVRPGDPLRFSEVGILLRVLVFDCVGVWGWFATIGTSAVTKVQIGLSTRTIFRTSPGVPPRRLSGSKQRRWPSVTVSISIDYYCYCHCHCWLQQWIAASTRLFQSAR